MSARTPRPRAALIAAVLSGLLATVDAATPAPTTAATAPPAAATATPAASAAGAATAANRAAAGSPACAPDPALPKRQFRAMWIASVANIDWPSPASHSAPDLVAAQQAEYRSWLDLAQRLHHNAVIVQVRPTADAFWPSPYEPWSEFLTGVQGRDPGWDPLAFLVTEAHRRNLEFHAWFNPYRVSMPGGAGADLDRLAADHPARRHPDWTVVYPADAPGSSRYYNPGIPEVRRFVQTAIMDAVLRYDIDGVHFDDYFYPYPTAGQDFPDAETFAAHGAGFTDRADWRRHNIDLLIREMGQQIKAAKPWVRFGVSPFGIWRNRSADPLGSHTSGAQSYDANYADTRHWVKREWIDYIVPQVYWHLGFAVADYAELVPWWARVVAGTRVQLYVGQADYKIGDPAQPEPWQDPAEMSRHLTFNRDFPQVTGNVHFSAARVRDNRLGATERYAAEHYRRPALTPAMPHPPATPPPAPELTAVERQSDGVRVEWRSPPDGAAVTSYVVYRLPGAAPPGACDLADARHIVGTVRATGDGAGSFVDRDAEPGIPYTYVVSAVDRRGNESEPSRPRPIP